MLHGFLDISSYLEPIPDPLDPTSYCPCAREYIQRGQEILYRLSCIAWNNSMYIAANMGDKVPCLRKDNFLCPFLGYFQYNTEVVFNQQGCLVAKYHKQHLFTAERLLWDVPRQVEFSYFDTDFGRFGLMICFDAVFKDPGIELVEKYHVTDIIFSTAWKNVYPHYVSVAYHSGWAMTMKVNYLSSNMHSPYDGYIGSGVYSPHGVINYTFNISSETGFLVIAKVPINKPLDKLNHQTVLHTAVGGTESFSSYVFGDKYKFISLEGDFGNISICHESVCCYLEYNRADNSYFYALGVFDGMHYLQGKYYLEVCLLTRCIENRQVCGTVTDNSESMFLSYNLTAVMNTAYAFPEVVSTADYNFTSDWKFVNDGYKKTIVGNNKTLTSVVLMGRNYDKDDPKADCTSYSSAYSLHSSPMLFLLVFIARWVS